MAEEVHYSSDSGSHKRKYDDNQTPPPSSRRQTGFSAPISSHSPPDSSGGGGGVVGHQQPSSYNNVPPPMDEIQLAKQKAQEIAARLFNNAAEATKRPRVENGAGFDTSEVSIPKPLSSSVAPPVPISYGSYPGPSKKIDIPNGRVGVIIGKGGETIKYLQLQSGAKIQVTRDMDADPNSSTRAVELMGTPEQISKAEQLINDVLSEADAGGSGIVSRRVTGQQSGAEQFVMKIPNNKVGLVIGKGGETIKNMQARTGARIQVIPLHLPPGDTSTERTLQIDGSPEQIETAKQLVNEVISENRLRNSGMGGGYPQQGYQARPPTSWAPPGPPMQQSGYGYLQPGAYPGSAPQYNMNQQNYQGYPPQTASGGYASGWDQTAASNQQTAQGGGYDYYGQQQPPQQQVAGGTGAPSDNTSSYGYNQTHTGYSQGQGYGQDGYGGYHQSASQSGYGQSQPNPAGGYDQQSYNSASGYGNASNPPADGSAASYGTQGDATQGSSVHSSSIGQQGYSSGQQPSPNANYSQQGSTQSGYGVPPSSQGGYGTQPPSSYGQSYGAPQSQKPPTSQPGYGQQPQQSPSAQGGYSQSGYPTAAQSAAYGQPDSSSSGAQRTPSSGYGVPAAQAGYGTSPYGAPPPVSQPNYGQQQTQAYSSGGVYGGGSYSQPPSYSSDGNSGGNARSTYDSAQASQGGAQQPTGTLKASPQS